MQATIQAYYRLTKPGIIYGNIINATGGFLLASRGHIDFWLLAATLAGISLVIAAACVFNNYIDRHIDKHMARTKKRALVLGTIPGRNALTYALLLQLAGFAILALATNLLTVVLGVIALFVYVVLYGIGKRRTVYGTIIGSAAGALPPVAGYVAVSNNFDTGALLLFLILTLWQMPHFYAIAMYRFDDYAQAKLPVLPVKKGMFITKINILLYIAAFTITTMLLTIFEYTGYTYLVVMAVVGLAWLWRGLQGFKAADDKVWARKMFLFSLIVILVFSASISLDAWLP
ncbi:MAG TPA: heme o synthase [Nevskiaceae bacterium]|nr:heme o synthase [Nevskiaceae bacterium]